MQATVSDHVGEEYVTATCVRLCLHVFQLDYELTVRDEVKNVHRGTRAMRCQQPRCILCMCCCCVDVPQTYHRFGSLTRFQNSSNKSITSNFIGNKVLNQATRLECANNLIHRIASIQALCSAYAV
jgi:hypothetical protein